MQLIVAASETVGPPSHHLSLLQVCHTAIPTCLDVSTKQLSGSRPSLEIRRGDKGKGKEKESTEVEVLVHQVSREVTALTIRSSPTNP